MPIVTNHNEKGQTLVAIVFAMIIALAIGVSISNRFITTLRSTSESYTSYRAEAVAEAAMERILLKTHDELSDFINYDSCGSDCTLTIINDDGLTETATIELSFLGSTTDPVNVQLFTHKIYEVNLEGYPDNTDVTFCWDNMGTSPEPAVTGLFIHGQDGTYEADSFGYNSLGSTLTNGFPNATSMSGHDSCFVINSLTNPQKVRLRSVYENVPITIIPATSTTLPLQGILIESTGQVLDTTRKVSAIKSEDILPSPFDYVLYSKSEAEPLSN